MNEIRYLSRPLPVHMSDTYFEAATLDHFWVRRRFQVFRALWGGRELAGTKLAEFGCGHGLVLRQFEDQLDLPGDGFDLNEGALKKAVSRRSRLFCYDIHQRHDEFREAYDLAVLFDVLEHIEDDAAFLRSIRFHLKPGGRIAVGVPAHAWLFSWYDAMMGHQRRYDIGLLRRAAEESGLRIEAWTYWGQPYVPVLWTRKRLASRRKTSEMASFKRGFVPPGPAANRLLFALGQLEKLPRTGGGISLMAILAPA